MVYYRDKNDIIEIKTISSNFHQVPLKVQINLICFKNVIRKKY